MKEDVTLYITFLVNCIINVTLDLGRHGSSTSKEILTWVNSAKFSNYFKTRKFRQQLKLRLTGYSETSNGTLTTSNDTKSF